ncbi:MAG: hypothetical protein DI582_02290 [Azospirillum brasilense]|nr:MAG: hypothetical protein DI582_02290 [Azospirillum brasilense]
MSHGLMVCWAIVAALFAYSSKHNALQNFTITLALPVPLYAAFALLCWYQIRHTTKKLASLSIHDQA